MFYQKHLVWIISINSTDIPIFLKTTQFISDAKYARNTISWTGSTLGLESVIPCVQWVTASNTQHTFNCVSQQAEPVVVNLK